MKQQKPARGRKAKRSVSFFPVYCTPSKTLEILESKYGKDGFVFFHKLMRVLGSEEGHFFDGRNKIEFEFLASKLNLSGGKLQEMLDYMAELDKIDVKLWEKKIIWYQGFVDTLEYAYNERSNDLPTKQECIEKCGLDLIDGKLELNDDELILSEDIDRSIDLIGVKTLINLGIKEKETKLNKTKNIYTKKSELEINNIKDVIISAFEIWNEFAVKNGLTVIKQLTDKRKISIKQRIQQKGFDFGEVLEAIQESSFLRGENKDQWKVSFDWIFESRNNWVKIIEGNYKDDPKNGGNLTERQAFDALSR